MAAAASAGVATFHYFVPEKVFKQYSSNEMSIKIKQSIPHTLAWDTYRPQSWEGWTETECLALQSI